MARIPDADIQRLKDEISVQRLVESAGVTLRKSGKDWLACCPFHEDETASLVITPAKNLWHCFGCQCGGGPIDWVMKFKGVSFRHAVELLKDETSLAAASSSAAALGSGVGGGMGGEPVKRTSVRSLPAPVTLDADDRDLLLQVVDYYHQSLKQSPEAIAYLASRGLTHPELIDHFQLGYANRTLGLRLPEKNRKAGADIRTRLERTTTPPGETEIYISHRGMVEVYEGSESNKRTVWQPRPADPGLEAEMLSRLMERFGVEKTRAKALLSEQSTVERAKLGKASNGAPLLIVSDPFDRAWRRVGLALDRVGFTVEDRDRSKGVYYVRYIDPKQDVETKKDTGFLSKMAFWRSSKPAANGDKYQIEVSENAAANASEVRVLTNKGTPAPAETSNKINQLLLEQLK